jgi:hypothetical protein
MLMSELHRIEHDTNLFNAHRFGEHLQLLLELPLENLKLLFKPLLREIECIDLHNDPISRYSLLSIKHGEPVPQISKPIHIEGLKAYFTDVLVSLFFYGHCRRKAGIAHCLRIGKVVSAVFVYEVVQNLRRNAPAAWFLMSAVLLQPAQIVLEVCILFFIYTHRALDEWAVIAFALKQVLLREAVYAFSLGPMITAVDYRLRWLFYHDGGLRALALLLGEFLLTQFLAEAIYATASLVVVAFWS